MKNINILEFNAKIYKNLEHSRIPCDNHENCRNPYENQANHENHRIPNDN